MDLIEFDNSSQEEKDRIREANEKALKELGLWGKVSCSKRE